MMLGPLRAPSSPPETPVPTYRRPLALAALSRRVVSGKWVLPPSIMPGGDEKAWPAVKPIFQAIAAKVDGNVPCCDWVGPEGAGHFVKMVHNGIEYGDIQLICEAYQILKDLCGLSTDELQKVFAKWNTDKSGSITEEQLRIGLDQDFAPRGFPR